MPLISAFYGILIYMYWLDTKQHKLPHIHAEYAGSEAVFSIDDGELLEGSMPPRQKRHPGMGRNPPRRPDGRLDAGNTRRTARQD